jgi:hypothetical protein
VRVSVTSFSPFLKNLLNLKSRIENHTDPHNLLGREKILREWPVSEKTILIKSILTSLLCGMTFRHDALSNVFRATPTFS